METKNQRIEGRTGKWDIIETLQVMSLTFGMAEHIHYGEEADILLCILTAKGTWQELDIMGDTLHNAVEEWLQNAVWSYIIDQEMEDKQDCVKAYREGSMSDEDFRLSFYGPEED